VSPVTVIGAGLAGCEAALQLARRGEAPPEWPGETMLGALLHYVSTGRTAVSG
jgi:folate-dependent tRNA-U54 methylase TrmFO/GidA